MKITATVISKGNASFCHSIISTSGSLNHVTKLKSILQENSMNFHIKVCFWITRQFVCTKSDASFNDLNTCDVKEDIFEGL